MATVTLVDDDGNPVVIEVTDDTRAIVFSNNAVAKALGTMAAAVRARNG